VSGLKECTDALSAMFTFVGFAVSEAAGNAETFLSIRFFSNLTLSARPG
jgi:hypothetical protein